MKFHIHHHEKLDGRALWLYSEKERTYNITNDLEPLEKANQPFKKIHPLRDEPVYFNPSRNIRTLAPPPEYNPLAAVQINGHPGEIPVEDFEVAIFQNRWPGLSDVSSEFKKDNHKVTIITSKHQNNLKSKEVINGVSVHRLITPKIKYFGLSILDSNNSVALLI